MTISSLSSFLSGKSIETAASTHTRPVSLSNKLLIPLPSHSFAPPYFSPTCFNCSVFPILFLSVCICVNLLGRQAESVCVFFRCSLFCIGIHLRKCANDSTDSLFLPVSVSLSPLFSVNYAHIFFWTKREVNRTHRLQRLPPCHIPSTEFYTHVVTNIISNNRTVKKGRWEGRLKVFPCLAFFFTSHSLSDDKAASSYILHKIIQ